MRKLIASLLGFAVLLGCDRQALFDKFIPKNEEALAKELIAKLSARDYPAIEARLDKSLQSPNVRSKLEEVAQLIPSGEPKSIHTVGAYTNSTNAATTYSLTFEYEFEHVWLVANVVMQSSAGVVSLTGIHITPHKQSLEVENAFSFAGKSWLHYATFVFAIAIPLFIIYALVACAKTRMVKRKWLWLLLVAIGFFQFQLNWTTGAWSFQPLNFLVLGAGFFKAGPAAPFILSIAFPLGAVLFLARRHLLQRVSDA